MYVCLNCGSLFDSGKRIKDETGEYIICPDCKGDSIDFAIKCHLCGEWYNDMQMATEHFCKTCVNSVQENTIKFFYDQLGQWERWCLLEALQDNVLEPEEVIPQGRID